MTECYSARCQQDRKLARREFNKWTKNVLLQIGLETISKNHLDFDVDHLLNPTDDEQIPNDFNPDEKCLFCVNRQEFLGNRKNKTRTNEHHHSITDTSIDDEENAPLDLSLKSTVNKSPVITSNNLKQRPFYDIKSDIPPMYGQEEFDRFMSEMITSQLDFSSPSFLNLNLFPTSPTFPIPASHSNKKKNLSSSSQDARIAQLAKQMAYERMLEEIDYQRHPSTTKKSKTSNNSSSSSSSILTESFHVNHILNDVMMRILQEMFEKQQQTSTVSQPRASRKGELLFVKKQNVNNDEQYNTNVFNQFINNNNNNTRQPLPKLNKKKINPSSSSSSSTSSVSSTGSSSLHTKTKGKSNSKVSTSYTPKGRAAEMINNNPKIIVGTDGKQIRPKRGQYRRYESEQLAKAVAAVLSNEMSVHKAGSYFGVPHSTLEYKVKERNIKVSSTSKPKNESTSVNDGDNNIPPGEINDDESFKGLVTYLPPSDSSTTNNHSTENDPSDDEFDEQID